MTLEKAPDILEHSDAISLDGQSAARLMELEQRSRQLSLVSAIARIVARSPEITDILEQALQRLLEFMKLDAGAVFLLEEGGKELYLTSSVGYSERYLKGVARFKLGDPLTARVARERRTTVVNDIDADRRPTSRVLQQEGVRAFAGIPLRSRNELLGVLNVMSRQPHQFDTFQTDLLRAVGDQLAVAIDNAQLFEKSARLAVVEERNWLAREIHDTLAQGLVALTLQIELALTQLADENDPMRANASLRKALNLARENLEEARRSVLHLRGDRMTSLGLANALAELAAEFEEDTGITVQLSVSQRLGSLPINLEEGIYRIAQEALSNIRKHAQPRSVQLAVQRSNQEARLTVRDDGKGFDPGNGAPPGHFGILGMGERAKLLGGRLEVESRPGQGTLVRVTAPIRRSLPGEGRP